LNTSRLLGIVLLVVGIAVGGIVAAWLFTNTELSQPARILGMGLALLVLVAPLVSAGLYLLLTGSSEAKHAQEAAQQRKVLDIVKTQGQVHVDELALEMQLPRDKVKDLIYSLVGLGVFSGYVNWDKGVLYSEDASKLRELKQCPNCGGEITLQGKGVATCRFCGTEFFLS